MDSWSPRAATPAAALQQEEYRDAECTQDRDVRVGGIAHGSTPQVNAFAPDVLCP